MKHVLKSFLIAGTLIFMGACGGGTTESSEAGSSNVADDNTPLGQASVVDNESDPNILQVAIGSPDHTTLVAAVQAAHIEHVLVNAGPLTVFAPTNDAFAKLPEGTVETLVKPENKATLVHILEGHVSPGNYKLEWMKDGMQMYMANGEYYNVEIKDGEYFVGGAKIIGTVPVSNGIVHVVDAVILPPPSPAE